MKMTLYNCGFHSQTQKFFIKVILTDKKRIIKKYGNYSISLQAIHVDDLRGVIDIQPYGHERNDSVYNVNFKQFSDELDVLEIVMYNKLNEHAFTTYVMDILEYSGDDLILQRGDRHWYKFSKPHWIYFKFE